VVRCPQGLEAKCFFQKHREDGWNEHVHSIDVEEKDGEVVPYLAIRDAAGLVSLVQFGVIEVHPWGSRKDRIERPDRLIFDLDPGTGVAWSSVVEGARSLRALLEELGLTSFVRTTGGKGLHVVCPIERRTQWDDAKEFARAVAERMRAEAPKRFVVNIRKDLRRGKILIDYLRNGRGATAIASYSVRARSGAPVAVNLSWDELDPAPASNVWTVVTLPRRLAAQRRDPWHAMANVRQSVTRDVWGRVLEGAKRARKSPR
jgi:bifunctional non-homologous end joining protein LigD